MSDAMTDEQAKEVRKQKLKEALKSIGHFLIVDVAPQVAKFALPLIVSYLTKKGIDSTTTTETNPS
jgi:hypothetical protein